MLSIYHYNVGFKEFDADLKIGLFTFVTSSYQKLEPKYCTVSGGKIVVFGSNF
jgi:hypothetical protein